MWPNLQETSNLVTFTKLLMENFIFYTVWDKSFLTHLLPIFPFIQLNLPNLQYSAIFTEEYQKQPPKIFFKKSCS